MLKFKFEWNERSQDLFSDAYPDACTTQHSIERGERRKVWRVHRLARSLGYDSPISAGQDLSLCAPSLFLSHYFSFLTLQLQTGNWHFGNSMALALAGRPTSVISQGARSMEGIGILIWNGRMVLTWYDDLISLIVKIAFVSFRVWRLASQIDLVLLWTWGDILNGDFESF